MKRVVAALLALLVLLTMLTPAMAVSPGLPNVVVKQYPDGAVLHLTFDEGSGTMAYNAVNSSQLNGTLLDANTTNADGNTPPQWVPGISGTALQFDGVDDYVSITDTINNSTSYTFTAWIKHTGNGEVHQGIILLSNSQGFVYLLKIFQNNKLNFQYWDELGTSHEYTIATIDPNVFYFASVTVNKTSNTLSLYLNGQRVNQLSLYSPRDNEPLSIYVGRGVLTQIFNGTIDEVYIFNRALSDEEIKLLYELTKPHKFSSQPTITPISIPVIDINTNQTAVVRLMESTTESSAYLPIPVGARNVNPASWVYTVNGDVLQIDDNRYVNTTSVTFEIPLQIYTNEISTIPSTLVLDSDSKTYRYEAEVNVYNPSDIDLIGVIGIDPSDIGVAQADMNGMFMAYNNGLLTNAAPIEPGHNQFKITAELPLEKKEVEFRATIDDYLEIDTFDEAVKAAESLAELKTDTMVKVITIETINFKDFGNRTVIVPLKGVRQSDVIEAKALTGSRPDIEVRKTDDGCELVIPPSAFTGELLDYNKAEIKLIYLKKPAWWEKIPFLKSLGGFFEFLKKLFGGG